MVNSTFQKIIEEYLSSKITSEEFGEKLKQYCNAQDNSLSGKYDFEEDIFLSCIFAANSNYVSDIAYNSSFFNEKELQTEVATLFGQYSEIIPFRDDYFKPALTFTSRSPEWELHSPSPYNWVKRKERSLLPEYFPPENVDMLPDFNYNWFFATLTLEDNTKLAIMVNFVNSYEVRKTVYNLNGKQEEYVYERRACDRIKMPIAISFSISPVEFSNDKVQLNVKNKKLTGKEINQAHIFHEDCMELPSKVYLLDSEETLNNKNIYSQRKEEYPFSTFYFKFSITCKEYENAEFVLDGLSYKGQVLPPLKVCLNFLEPEKIALFEKKIHYKIWVQVMGMIKKRQFIHSIYKVLENYFSNNIDAIEFWDQYIDSYQSKRDFHPNFKLEDVDDGFISSIFVSADCFCADEDRHDQVHLNDKELRTEVAILFGQVSDRIPYRDDYFKPALIPTLLSPEWEILAPQTNTWTERQKRSLLPNEFPHDDVDMLPDFNYNWFFSKLPLPDNTHLSVLIRFLETYEIRRTIYHADEVEEYIYERRIDETGPFLISISFTQNDVDFVNDKIQLLLQDRVLIGKEMNRFYGTGYTSLPTATYHLNSEETLKTKNVYSHRTNSYPFSTFYFWFNLHLQEFENAEFVLGGLSYKGQALPSLRVKLNYVDYDKVKNYKAMPYVNLKEENEITNQ